LQYKLEYKLEYQLDFLPLREFAELLENKGIYPELYQAIEVSGEHIKKIWIRNANAVLNHTQGDYVNGIVSGVQYPYENDPLVYSLINKSKHAYRLEYGNEAWDMKKFLQTSDKIRMTKKGEKYLVIPFRHGIPGTKNYKPMPEEIYSEAKYLGASQVTGFYHEGSIKGAQTYKDALLLKQYNPSKVKRRSYKWGDKLRTTDETSIYNNMYRFETNTHINRKQVPVDAGKFVNRTPSHNIQSSIYLTFRIMKESHSGWIYPRREGKYILKKSIEEGLPLIMQLLSEAGKMDITNLLNSLK